MHLKLTPKYGRRWRRRAQASCAIGLFGLTLWTWSIWFGLLWTVRPFAGSEFSLMLDDGSITIGMTRTIPDLSMGMDGRPMYDFPDGMWFNPQPVPRFTMPGFERSITAGYITRTLWIPFWLVALPAFGFHFLAARAARRELLATSNPCRECGHPLMSGSAERCPECGFCPDDSAAHMSPAHEAPTP